MPLFLARISLTPTPDMAAAGEAEAAFVAAQLEAGTIRRIDATPDKSMTWHLLDLDNVDDVGPFVQRYPFAPWFRIEDVEEVVQLA